MASSNEQQALRDRGVASLVEAAGGVVAARDAYLAASGSHDDELVEQMDEACDALRKALAALPAAPALPASIVERAQAWVAADADDDTPQESSHDIVRDLAKLPVDGEADALRKQLDEAKGELDSARESLGTLRPCLKEITSQLHAAETAIEVGLLEYRGKHDEARELVKRKPMSEEGTRLADKVNKMRCTIELQAKHLKHAEDERDQAKAATTARAVEELRAFREQVEEGDDGSGDGFASRWRLVDQINTRITALEAEPQPITTVLTPEDMGAELQRELLQPSTEPEQPITTDAVRCFEQGMEPPQGGQLWRKTTVVRMWKQDAPFLCQSREGALRGEPGDFLAQDGHGGYYPVSAEFHGKHYESAEPKTEMAFAEPEQPEDDGGGEDVLVTFMRNAEANHLLGTLDGATMHDLCRRVRKLEGRR